MDRSASGCSHKIGCVFLQGGGERGGDRKLPKESLAGAVGQGSQFQNVVSCFKGPSTRRGG